MGPQLIGSPAGPQEVTQHGPFFFGSSFLLAAAPAVDDVAGAFTQVPREVCPSRYLDGKNGVSLFGAPALSGDFTFSCDAPAELSGPASEPAVSGDILGAEPSGYYTFHAVL